MAQQRTPVWSQYAVLAKLALLAGCGGGSGGSGIDTGASYIRPSVSYATPVAVDTYTPMTGTGITDI